MPTPLIPAQGSQLEGHPVPGTQPFAALCCLRWRRGFRGKQMWGHWHHLGPVEAGGEVGGHPGPGNYRELCGCPPACEGGRQYSIYFNKHFDVPVISVFLAGAGLGRGAVLCLLCPGGTHRAMPQLSGHPERVMCWSRGCRLHALVFVCPVALPPRRKAAGPDSHCISLLWMSLHLHSHWVEHTL